METPKGDHNKSSFLHCLQGCIRLVVAMLKCNRRCCIERSSSEESEERHFRPDDDNAFANKIFDDIKSYYLTEWDDAQSFRGHVALEVTDFNSMFYRCKELGIIDTKPWGKVRQLPHGVMQMFIRDPSGNLVEISSPPSYKDQIDPAIFEDEFYQDGIYVSGRNDFRGHKRENATLYHGEE